MARLSGMKIIAVLASLWLLLAPLPRGIALNLETTECAGYWGGDEYASTTLPEGWVAYYPGSDLVIETEVGSCDYTSTSEYGPAENCCRQLGFRYVGPQIGRTRVSPLMYLGLGVFLLQACGTCLVILVVVALVLGISLLLLRWIRRRGRRANPTAPTPNAEGEVQDV
jgi:hypothetical protein